MVLLRNGRALTRSFVRTCPKTINVRNKNFAILESATFRHTIVHSFCNFIVLLLATVSAAILSGYFGAFVLYKLFSAIGGGSKAAAPAEEAAAAPAKAAPATGGVPDVDSPEFETFVGSEAFIKVLENEEQLMGWIKKAEA